MALARCCCWPDLPLASVAHSPAALPHGPRAGTALLPGAGGYAAAALASAHVQLRRLGAEQLGRLLLLTASGPHPDETRQHELQAMLVGALQVQTCGRPLKTFHAACTHECWPAVPLARVPSLPVAAGCAAQILHAWCYYCPWTERGPPYMPTHPPPAHYIHPTHQPTHRMWTRVSPPMLLTLLSHTPPPSRPRWPRCCQPTPLLVLRCMKPSRHVTVTAQMMARAVGTSALLQPRRSACGPSLC